MRFSEQTNSEEILALNLIKSQLYIQPQLEKLTSEWHILSCKKANDNDIYEWLLADDKGRQTYNDEEIMQSVTQESIDNSEESDNEVDSDNGQ